MNAIVRFLRLFLSKLNQVFARHQRLAAATRAAVEARGLEILCLEPAEYSPVLTAVLMPPGHDADQYRRVVLDNFNMSLGSGLTKLAGKVLRIGHLGQCNDVVLMGALSGVEMGLAAAGVPHRAGGAAAALRELEAADTANSSRSRSSPAANETVELAARSGEATQTSVIK